MFLLLELEWKKWKKNKEIERDIIQKMEGNNIRFNNKCHRKYISNYENQREYTKEVL